MATKIGVFQVDAFYKDPYRRAEVTVGKDRYTQASPSGKHLATWAAKLIGPKELSTWKS